MSNSEKTATEDKNNILRKRPKQKIKLLVIVVIVIVAAVWLAFWLHHRLTHVSTSDAQVASHVITLSSRLPGQVTQFNLIEGDSLQKNDVVAKLDSKPARLKLNEINAEIDHIETQLSLATQQISGGVQVAQSLLEADQAAARAAKANMSKAHTNYARAQKLYQSQSGSEKQRDIYKFDYESARADYKRAQSQVQMDKVSVANAKTGLLSGGLISNPDVLKTELKIAKAKRAHQKNRIHDLIVRSKIDGVVDQTFIEPGEYVSAGQPILMMHDPSDVWIQAKIKETEIRSLSVGQHVDIEVDAYPKVKYSGHVQVIGHAATNQFAMLPDPNPSGNFTKITQRIPVRIKIDHGPKPKLAPGMMVEVYVNTSGGNERDSNQD